jgi:hypothetical protein
MLTACANTREKIEVHRLVRHRPLLADGGKSHVIILVLNQYNCIGCSPGKHPDTRTMAIGSDDDSLDSVRDRCLCIAV